MRSGATVLVVDDNHLNLELVTDVLTGAGYSIRQAVSAEQALAAIAKTAKWEIAPHPSSKAVYDYLRERVPGGAPTRPSASKRMHE